MSGVLPRVARPEHGDLAGSCDLVAVRDAQNAAGRAAQVASAALEDVSEEGLQGVGGITRPLRHCSRKRSRRLA